MDRCPSSWVHLCNSVGSACSTVGMGAPASHYLQENIFPHIDTTIIMIQLWDIMLYKPHDKDLNDGIIQLKSFISVFYAISRNSIKISQYRKKVAVRKTYGELLSTFITRHGFSWLMVMIQNKKLPKENRPYGPKLTDPMACVIS